MMFLCFEMCNRVCKERKIYLSCIKLKVQQYLSNWLEANIWLVIIISKLLSVTKKYLITTHSKDKVLYVENGQKW